jgi:hypothetical protein
MLSQGSCSWIPDAVAGLVQLCPLLCGDKRRAWNETQSGLWVE